MRGANFCIHNFEFCIPPSFIIHNSSFLLSYSPEQINCIRIGEGPPVVMVHGNPATHTLWRPVAERVAAERSVYLLDLPGFGASPPPRDRRDYSLEKLASLVLAVADRHDLDRFDLVGHSFGGAISLTIASIAPSRLRTLAVITPMTDHKPPLAHLAFVRPIERIAAAAWQIASHELRQLIAHNWTHVSYGKGYSRGRAEEVREEADRPDTVRSMCGLLVEADYAAYTKAIEKVARDTSPPLLMIGAGRDRIIPHRQFLDLRARLARAEYHLLPESGHVPMWQHPDEVAEMLRGFWRNDEL
jgi:4,5:9,10-diseco-3-hydroxy-5,9,17-trioxoandrosta-1(10),2-diene-4-oate hydrolase